MSKAIEKLKALAFEAGWDAAIENHTYEYVGMAEDETAAFQKWNDSVNAPVEKGLTPNE